MLFFVLEALENKTTETLMYRGEAAQTHECLFDSPATDPSVQIRESEPAEVIDLLQYRKDHSRPEVSQTFLINKAKEGDEHAFMLLANRMRPYIAQIAVRRAGVYSINECLMTGLAELPRVVERFDKSKGNFINIFAIRAEGAMVDETRKLKAGNGLSRKNYKKLTQALESDDTSQALHDLVVNEKFSIAPSIFNGTDINCVPLSIDRILDDGQGNSIDTCLEPMADCDVHEEAFINITRKMLPAALNKLPEKQKTVLIETYGLFGAPVAETSQIAKKIALSQSQVNRLRKQAVINLHSLLIEGEKIVPEPPNVLVQDEPMPSTSADRFRSKFTKNELRVICRLFETPKQIASELCVEWSTIRSILHEAVKKTEYSCTEELAVEAAKAGIIKLTDVPGGRTDKLTDKQRLILQQAYNTSEVEASNKLGISLGTVRGHRFNLRKKLGIRTNTQAAILAVKDGLI